MSDSTRREVTLKVRRYKKWATTAVVLTVIGALAGCGTTQPPSPKTNATTTSTQPTGSQTAQRPVYDVDTNGTTFHIHPGQVTYNRAAEMIHVVMTNRGVVWNPIPKMKLAISEQTTTRNHPLQPFSIYLNTSNDRTLTTVNSTKLLSLPLREQTSIGTVFEVLSDLFSAGDFVIYTVDLQLVGTVQPLSSEMYALNLNTDHSDKITSYHSDSGNLFSIVVSGEDVYYKQVLENGSETIHEYRLITDKSKQVISLPSGLKWISL